ncbi:uncharacterized protein PgNI_11797 [Pyricularia grisea]|uniref:Dynactin subunit 4 n=1 Tax=Pyricularia grisea TaxID=148305 RepID=A0A6P8ANK7_PYRGI|nr:uncharacterized protein PgNI_11797 [Pyricularia grisea]TLD03614.1 hypothetical protein PgNI_11797 [Pyricularia grisea]
MAPYTYIQCPCSDPSDLGRPQGNSSPTQSTPTKDSNGNLIDEDDEDGRTFDPRAPRSNYSLYPIEYLLYCEDCHQIRCPRCVAEEVVTYFCPSCLFEVPSSNIKSEGNRCTRSCFQCPICVGILSVTSLEPSASSRHLAADNTAALPGGPYALNCSYCQWSSLEVGIKFDRSNAIYGQLAKLRNGGRPRLSRKEQKERREEQSSYADSGIGAAPSTIEEEEQKGTRDGRDADDDELDVETQFAKLKSFYKSQLADTATSSGTGGLSSLGNLANFGLGSPGSPSMSRLMFMYTGANPADTRRKTRMHPMREAIGPQEGLKVLYEPNAKSQEGIIEEGSEEAAQNNSKPKNGLDEHAAIVKLRDAGWDATTTAEQRAAQAPNVAAPVSAQNIRFQDDLRPIPVLLRTKRSKRCPMCRHIMTKPEAKVASNRFRIRLVAGNYIPSISARYLSGGNPPPAEPPGTVAAHHLLKPLEPVQYLLTFKNPIFESVRVSLATPSVTPGRFGSKVTLLCPQFEIGANTDVWDEVLKDGAPGADASARRRTMVRKPDGEGGQPEAGKIWEKGRNWVSVVVEIVPASLRVDMLGLGKPASEVDRSPLKEDEDLLEIPMFVRVEWEADAANDDVGQAIGKDKDTREKRELAYWCVVGIGRISQD